MSFKDTIPKSIVAATIFMSIVFSGRIFAQNNERESKKHELEQQKKDLQEYRDSLISLRDELRKKRAHKRAHRIDSVSLNGRVSAHEIIMMSSAEILFPQSPMLTDHKGSFHIDVMRLGYYPNINFPMGFRFQLTSGVMFKESEDKLANNSNSDQLFEFSNQLNFNKWMFGLKLANPYSQNTIHLFASTDLIIGVMTNMKVSHPLNESGKIILGEDGQYNRFEFKKTFLGFRVKSGIEISLNKLFNFQKETYRGEGLFFQSSISYSQSFNNNVNYLSPTTDYDPINFDPDKHEKIDFPKINHTAQATKINTYLSAYSIHFGFVYRGFNFKF